MDTSTPLLLKNMSPDGQDVAARLIKEWHATLQTQRGWRAELRRADSPAELLLCSVITSYSIHYTKLYEELVRFFSSHSVPMLMMGG